MTDYYSGSTAVLDPPAVPGRLPSHHADDRLLTILGVEITDVTRRRAIELLQGMIDRHRGRTGRVFFVNAHTLNLAAADRTYREVLRAADHVFGDGTGVRWAGYLQGVKVRDNLAGTDLVPALLRETAGYGYRYFLLGSDEQTIRRAAAAAAETYPGWTLAGYHHGYLTTSELTASAVRQINRARPHLLLVGMGNPLQERWIHAHQQQLDVPLCMAVGGLFDFWAENVSRAPQWLRNLGHEWLWRLGQQPSDKAKRYLLGNPLFLARAAGETWAIRRRPVRSADVTRGYLNPSARTL
jgi:N-acetylglucosaminyldiphosphoundecaprenol N-acetyl-beta-D-mannosaminyltransferase